MASISEEEILENLRRLESGQQLTEKGQANIELLTTRALDLFEQAQSAMDRVSGEQVGEEEGYQTQRGEESRYAGMAGWGGGADDEGGKGAPTVIDIENDDQILSLTFESSLFAGRVNAIDMLMDYVSRFSRDELGKKFWMDVVLPPLRNTIGKIFTTQGAGTWKALSPDWAREKANPAFPGFSLGGKGKESSKILSWRGKYRRALTGKKGLPNTQNPRGAGTIFQPLQGGNWKSGFEYGVDVGWFSDMSRRSRGDDLEADYPIKHEGGSESRFRFINYIPKKAQEVLGAFGFDYDAERDGYIIVTTKQAKRLEKIGIRSYLSHEFGKAKVDTKVERGRLVKTVEQTPLTFDIPARPVWGLFRRENLTIIKNFYDGLGERMARNIGRYMEKAERQEWYKGSQSHYRSSIQGVSMGATSDNIQTSQPPQRQADQMSYQEIYEQHGHSEGVRRHLYEEMETAIEGGKGINVEEQRIFRELEEEFEFSDFDEF